MSDSLQRVPARRGAAAVVRAGQTIKIINTHGKQVVDTWAFAIHTSKLSAASSGDAPVFPNATATSPSSYSEVSNQAASKVEYMSMSHTRAKLCKITPQEGDTLVSQKRMPMVTITKDTSNGVHDTLICACDRWRYGELGVQGYHENCTDNCWDALNALAASLSSSGNQEEVESIRALLPTLGGRVPDPFNLFMNIPVSNDGELAKRTISFEEPLTEVGDYVCLKAERDVVVAMSACPQDLLMINGGEPQEAHFQILDS